MTFLGGLGAKGVYGIVDIPLTTDSSWIYLNSLQRWANSVFWTKYKSYSDSNENEMKTRPIILCVAHQMSREKGNCSDQLDQLALTEIIQLAELCLNTRWWIISGTWLFWVTIWRYWLVLGQYKLVLLGIRWYRVSKGLVCLYILEKVDIWSGVTDP